LEEGNARSEAASLEKLVLLHLIVPDDHFVAIYASAQLQHSPEARQEVEEKIVAQS
jgi:hypothetical protein